LVVLRLGGMLFLDRTSGTVSLFLFLQPSLCLFISGVSEKMVEFQNLKNNRTGIVDYEPFY